MNNPIIENFSVYRNSLVNHINHEFSSNNAIISDIKDQYRAEKSVLEIYNQIKPFISFEEFESFTNNFLSLGFQGNKFIYLHSTKKQFEKLTFDLINHPFFEETKSTSDEVFCLLSQELGCYIQLEKTREDVFRKDHKRVFINNKRNNFAVVFPGSSSYEFEKFSDRNTYSPLRNEMMTALTITDYLVQENIPFHFRLRVNSSGSIMPEKIVTYKPEDSSIELRPL